MTGKLPSVAFEYPPSFVARQEHAGHELAYVGCATHPVLWLPELEPDSWLVITNESAVRPSWLRLFGPPGCTWDPYGMAPVVLNGQSILLQSV